MRGNDKDGYSIESGTMHSPWFARCLSPTTSGKVQYQPIEDKQCSYVGHCQLVETDTVIRQTATLPRTSYLLGSPFRTCHFGSTRKLLPHLLTVYRRGQQMPSRADVLGTAAIGREEARRLHGGCEPLQAPLALTRGVMKFSHRLLTRSSTCTSR
jgi:hypothetical protein